MSENLHFKNNRFYSKLSTLNFSVLELIDAILGDPRLRELVSSMYPKLSESVEDIAELEPDLRPDVLCRAGEHPEPLITINVEALATYLKTMKATADTKSNDITSADELSKGHTLATVNSLVESLLTTDFAHIDASMSQRVKKPN